MFTITFTKVFTPGSLLEGLTYTETISFPTRQSTSNYVAFLEAHTTEPVKAIGGSDYTVTAIQVN